MKQFMVFITLVWMISCTTHVEEEGIIGTWKYTAVDAPFGFQSGKVIFYEENDSIKAKLKIYGFTLPANNLIIEENKISFSAWVETEEVAINLEMQNGKMLGSVKASDLSSPISMVKKGHINSSDSEKIFQDKLISRAQIEAVLKQRKNVLADGVNKEKELNYRVHTFYYGWFGNPDNNGAYKAWSGGVVPHTVDTTWNNAKPYPGGEDITSNFYPQLGCYSSIDTDVIDIHMQQIKQAGIGVVVLSWWGNGGYTDKSVNDILNIAHKYGLKIAFHIEPFYKTVDVFKTNLKYISETYNQHPAIYMFEGKPMYYLYNSFQLNHDDWFSMLNPESETTIRNTKLDGVFISLWTTRFDGEFTVKADFDGFYTYFASDGFSHGSTTENWPGMAAFAQENNLVYCPSVGPGYIDTRIRPWNEKNTKAREEGKYYETMFEKAVNTKPDFIGITSFNEWHEGTQIESSVPKELPNYTYEDFGKDVDPLFYINKTKELIDKYILIKTD